MDAEPSEVIQTPVTVATEAVPVKQPRSDSSNAHSNLPGRKHASSEHRRPRQARQMRSTEGYRSTLRSATGRGIGAAGGSRVRQEGPKQAQAQEEARDRGRGVFE
eukprot:7009562-Prymnesium_polylepis.2